MKTLSENMADYVLQTNADALEPAVIEQVKKVLLDTTAVVIHGRKTRWSRMVENHYREIGGAPQASVIGDAARLPMASAAMVNGTAAHSFDYDDDLAACHIACCVLPAAIAAGQSSRSSGKRLIEAVAAGYTVTVGVARALDGHALYAQGFHPTSVCGVFGAAAAAGKLLGLSRAELANAFGIAGSCSSGTLEWVADGAMTKRLHAGMAAAAGVIAASLARRGFTGPRRIFEGDNGVFTMFKASGNTQALGRDLWERQDILMTYIKRFPCCTCNAPVIDAILDLKEEHKIRAEDVSQVIVQVRRTCLDLVGRPLASKQDPTTVLEAQMSGPYCAAAALVFGRVFPEQFTPEAMQTVRETGLMKRIILETDESLNLDGDPRPVPAVVRILTSGHRSVSKKVIFQKGTYKDPISKEDLEQKFEQCTAETLSTKESRRFIQKVDTLETIEDINDLVDLTVSRDIP